MIINPPTSGTFKGSITMYVDGKVINTKEFTITVSKKLDGSEIANQVTSWSGTEPTNVNAHKSKNGNNTGDSISKSKFSDLYNDNTIICLKWGQDETSSNWGRKGKEIVTERLNTLGEYVVATICASIDGLDKDILEQAMQTVVDRYIADGSNSDKNSFIERYAGDTPERAYDLLHDDDHKLVQAVIHVKDPDGDDSNYYGITFKTFVDAIIDEYNKLIG